MNALQARIALLVMASLLLGGCAPGGGSPTASSAPVTGTASGKAAATITIRGFAYGPPLTVAPGAVVAVTNTDSAEHTVTADEGAAFDVDVQGSGGTATLTAPKAPGTYPYHCTYHSNMHGTLIVK